MAVQIQRDAFARCTLMRDHIIGKHDCAFCGQPARFVYWWEADRIYAAPRPLALNAFCSVGCFRAY